MPKNRFIGYLYLCILMFGWESGLGIDNRIKVYYYSMSARPAFNRGYTTRGFPLSQDHVRVFPKVKHDV
uniref:Uncharacterized protein n=1 Tax=Picea glauca TaxID=3330 RepID=A0A117NJ94_PICGL|nr:hypothetical protein ABT39_MTgene1002 [Picea glauca]QHR87345.1 hypothetical protein Q903MT_gene1355 [Picea sitchensis]